MNYAQKDLTGIKFIEDLLKYDPDVREKLDMENDNTVIDSKKKIKHTGKNMVLCPDRSGKGVSVVDERILKKTNKKIEKDSNIEDYLRSW